jgi:antitoxin (DNA-binding transcriptional repressor) of toxin-antitoxin stability system
MKKASVRDLRYRFSIVEELLRDGQEIHTTKRTRFIARSNRAHPHAGLQSPHEKDLRQKKLKLSGADLAAKDREERV